VELLVECFGNDVALAKEVQSSAVGG
jgi:hypothetical protein